MKDFGGRSPGPTVDEVEQQRKFFEKGGTTQLLKIVKYQLTYPAYRQLRDTLRSYILQIHSEPGQRLILQAEPR
ncbi:MAG TPA: hypothetical protein V6D03_11415 [Candidatus Caenarcaniphilales bacterium]